MIEVALEMIIEYITDNHYRIINDAPYLLRPYFTREVEACRFFADPDSIQITTEEIKPIELDESVLNRFDYQYQFKGKVKVSGQVELDVDQSLPTERIDLELDFEIRSWINLDNRFIGHRVYDNELRLIMGYNELLFKKYHDNDLICLSVPNYTICGDPPMSYYTSRLGALSPIRDSSNWSKQFDELVNCSKDIKYHLGELLVYKPYLPTKLFKPFNQGGKIVYSLDSNLYQRRYLQSANILFEKVYNYWDKLGDLLDLYIETGLSLKAVDFSRVLAAIQKQHYRHVEPPEEFSWLLRFRSNEYNELNRIRKDVVHYFYIETQLMQEFLDNVTNLEKLKELERRFYGYDQYFKWHLNNCLDGFQKAVEFIRQFHE